MVLIKNVRTAIQQYRSWRAQKQLTKEALNRGKRKKYERLADQSKRDFLATCGRAAIIPGIVLGGGIPLVYHLLTKQSKTKEVTSYQTQAAKAKNIILDLLKNIQSRKTMSPRYFTFIDTIIKLIESNKICFAILSDFKEDDQSHVYDQKTKTVKINPIDFDPNSIYFRSRMIHELFHAYQDFKKAKIMGSRLEAEAHLAENDYLYHHRRPRPEKWLILENSPRGKSAFTERFNIPPSVVEKTIKASFDSSEYKQAITTIAKKYLWFCLFEHIRETTNAVSLNISRSGMSLSQIKKARKEFLTEMRRNSASKNLTITGVKDARVDSSVLNYVAYSQSLIHRAPLKEARVILSETYREFFKHHSSLDISGYDEPFTLNGIE